MKYELMNLINNEFNIIKLVVGQLGTNCYIVATKKKKGIIIDPGDCAKEILNFVEREKIEIKYILNTHGHYDHTGANYIKNQIDSRPLLGIHKNDLIYLSDDCLNLSICFETKGVYIQPDFFLSDNQIIELTEEISLRVIHTPGHTPGSVCLQLVNYLFSGDLLFCNGIGRTDLPGGNENLLLKSLKKISQLEENTIILPGHGPETTLSCERETNPYFVFNWDDDEC